MEPRQTGLKEKHDHELPPWNKKSIVSLISSQFWLLNIVALTGYWFICKTLVCTDISLTSAHEDPGQDECFVTSKERPKLNFLFSND